ncbi:MAG: hypothetical protein SFU56_12715 [Capsulimonadales bacterium]|nr:hypothetical protein [Capsulimonadales bacterium]
MASVRFWGHIRAIRPRLILVKFESETTAKSQGHILLIDGTRTENGVTVPVRSLGVAVGTAQRPLRVGDLIRGEGEPVPGDTVDVPADLYRVGVLRVIAPAGSSGATPIPAPDPPRTDPPLSVETMETAPRSLLNPENLAESGPCHSCPYGGIVALVRLTDPRNLKTGIHSRAAACLGPDDCPHYASP